MQKIVWTLFLFQLYIGNVLCSNITEVNVNWADFMINAKWVTNKLVKEFEPYVVENYPFGNVSEKCTNSLKMYVKGFKEWEPWAIKMFDFTGKFPSGFLSGTLMSFGSFDDCMEMKEISMNEYETFKTQFCILSLKSELFSPINWKTSSGKTYIETYGQPPSWIADTMMKVKGGLDIFGLFLGVCIPSACSEQDLHNIIVSLTKPASLDVSLSDCQTNDPIEWPTSAKIVNSFLICLLVLCLWGTLLEQQDRNVTEQKRLLTNENFPRKLLKAFSLRTNFETLCELKVSRHTSSAVNGIKVFATFFIITEHAFMFPSRWKEQHHTNSYHIFQTLPPSFRFADNGLQYVNIFYILTGYFVGQQLWIQLEKTGGKINALKLIWDRYLRLASVMLFTILLPFGLPVLFSGPVWNSTWETELEKCRKYGWLNILFLQNFLKNEDICWMHTWFMAGVMQLMIISVPYMILTYRHPKTGISLGVLMIIGCCIHDYFVSVSNQFPFPNLMSLRDLQLARRLATAVYQRPTHHLGTQLLGMGVGYLVLTKKNRKLSKMTQTIGWILTTFFLLFVIYAVLYPTEDIRITALYFSTRNILWNLALCWIVYTSFTDSAGIVGEILSLKVFIPMSNVSHWAYLLNPPVPIFFHSLKRERVYMSKVEHGQHVLIHMFFTFLVSFIVFLIFEAPLNNLINLFSKKRKEKEDSEQLNEKSSSRNVKISEKEL